MSVKDATTFINTLTKNPELLKDLRSALDQAITSTAAKHGLKFTGTELRTAAAEFGLKRQAPTSKVLVKPWKLQIVTQDGDIAFIVPLVA